MDEQLKCPVCGGTDLCGHQPTYDRVGHIAKGSCYRRMECENCGSDWLDLFTFTRHAAITNPAPHQLRVVAERNELQSRLEKLAAFISSSPNFRTVDEEEQIRLDYMGNYLNVLNLRIAAFTK